MRGHVQTLEPGKHRLYVDRGRDALTGKRRQITETFSGTRREADQRLARLLVEVEEGRAGTAAKTVGELIERWYARAERKLSPWTLRSYRSKIDAHIVPALGDLPLRRLTTDLLDEFYATLEERGNKRAGREGRPLSAQSVRHVHSVIHRACEQAIRWGWLDRNPADRVELPQVDSRGGPVPPVEDVLAILDLVVDDLYEFALLAIVAGARRGELCGLRWSDLLILDGKTAQLTISRSVADLPNQPVIVKATKTNTVRRLALDDATAAMLNARRKREAERALACGLPYSKDAYIFSDDPGGTEPLRPQLATKRWLTAAAKAGVRCRLHDLRHFAITELLEAGFEIGGVSKRHGHARTSITQDLYQHARRSGDVAAAEYLSGLVRRKRNA